MCEQQAGGFVDQKNLLHAIYQAVQKNDFGERLAGADRFQAPANSLRRKAVLHGLIERLEHGANRFRDGLANGGAHYREQSAGENAGIFADRFAQRLFHRGHQRFIQVRVAAVGAAQLDGLRDDGAQILCASDGIVEAVAQGIDFFLFRSEENVAQILEFLALVFACFRRVFRLILMCRTLGHFFLREAPAADLAICTSKRLGPVEAGSLFSHRAICPAE